jgi:pimeloyl-ACP methyl ester carboxylesterase
MLFMKTVATGLVVVLAMIVLILAGMIAFGTAKSPTVMRSITDVAAAINYRDMPVPSRFPARDGSMLAYRAYPTSSQSIVILIHGSSASSFAMHALAQAIQAHGVTAFAVDVRGHGDSGLHGDISYIGQLEDDLADFVAYLRKSYPNSPITLVGHSSGGGFALRVAGSSIGSLFTHYVLLAPYLGYNAPTVRPATGGWAAPFVPRILTLTILQKLHINAGSGLAVIAFAVPKDLDERLTTSYSFRLLKNFGPPEDYLGALARSPAPVTVLVGERDETMWADRFTAALDSVKDHVTVRVLRGIGHMNIVSNPQALVTVVGACLAQP